MTKVDTRYIKTHIKDGYRPCLFDVDIESFSDMKYYIYAVEYAGGTNFQSEIGLRLVIKENEDFYVRKSLDEFLNKILTIRAYKKNGDLAYVEKFRIKNVDYYGDFSWENTNELFSWNVYVNVEKIDDID